MNQIHNHKPVYDYELMEQWNSFLVVSLILTGLPSKTASSGKPFSFLDMLPVTDLDSESSGTIVAQQK